MARLYHVHGVRQREIGTRLGISQAQVSRMLRRAEDLGIVRTMIAVPEGVHPELEEAIEQRFGLLEVHVVEVTSDGPGMVSGLGSAAARLLGDALVAARTVGFTSWSQTLQAMAFALPEIPRSDTRHVVEMLGDLGSPSQQHSAARSTQSMAAALGAEPVFLRTPGVVATPALRGTAQGDAYVHRALGLLDDLDIALVGVGPPAVHSQLRAGDSYFTPDQLAQVRAEGAAGQLNQRFLDAAGEPLSTALDELVVGSTLQQLRAAGRRVVVAGGPHKQAPIAAALRGGWIDVLVTDLSTARYLTG